MSDAERAVEDAAKEGRKLTYDADGTTFMEFLNLHPEDAKEFFGMTLPSDENGIPRWNHIDAIRQMQIEQFAEEILKPILRPYVVSGHFKDAEITRLRAALADAQAVGFAAGVEAAAKWLLCKAAEQGNTKTPQGRTAIYYARKVRALTPPDATAAAARVLLGVWPTDASFDAAFNACAASYHGGDQMQDVMDRTRATVSAAIRAIAGDTP